VSKGITGAFCRTQNVLRSVRNQRANEMRAALNIAADYDKLAERAIERLHKSAS
jgi:hypothetical protein